MVYKKESMFAELLIFAQLPFKRIYYGLSTKQYTHNITILQKDKKKTKCNHLFFS